MIQMKKTPLYDEMVRSGGRMVDFAGFVMPVQFAGIISEHLAVRRNAGLFDVSHMGEVLVSGKDAERYIDKLVTNAVGKLSDRQVMYSPMCYDHGGCVDDLLVYRFNPERYLLVVNASNTDKDFSHMLSQIHGFSVKLENLSDQYAQLAVQGPKAIHILSGLTDLDLDNIDFYWFREGLVNGSPSIVSRTGYTGEDGFEIYCRPEAAPAIWSALLIKGSTHGIQPCGLGARDTLRFENRLVLYGHELDEHTSPLAARLNWAIGWDSDFNGKQALAQEKETGSKKKLVGLEMKETGVPRQGYSVYAGEQESGVVTSGCKAPFLDKFLALAYVKPEHSSNGTELLVDIRGKKLAATVVKTPFYKKPPISRLTDSAEGSRSSEA
ncbi:MAG: glycine cleavage system aminomethyltransferase GcvT [Candidatus Wallbacteria bacterium]|nr:glycine cleavage system aminomethyltransferase GcvT [Candidatus Wallbacteria bacterium]